MSVDPPASAANQNAANSRGKLAVAGMVGVALVLATFAWWWNYNSGRAALEFYGPEAAHLIRTSPTVEILVVGGGGGSTGTARLPGPGYPIQRRIDIGKAPGLIHARASLLNDASYEEESTQAAVSKLIDDDETTFVRFADGKSEVVLGFHASGTVYAVSTGRRRQLVPKTAAGWQQFLKRHTGKSPEAGA